MPILSVASLALGLSGPLPPLYCPATLEKITGKPFITVEYGGILFGTCCVGCGNPLLRDPKPLLAEAIKEKFTVGSFIYDPVSGLRIDEKKAPEYADYASIRYFFSSKDEKKAFLAHPEGYVAAIQSEAYFCPVTKHPTTWSDAAAFADFNGVRYFLANADSLAQFKADPAKFVASVTAQVKPLKAVVVKH